MVALPVDLQRQILAARLKFRQQISSDQPGAYLFYRKNEYIHSHTILNNIFFGRLKTANPQIQDRINEQIVQLLIGEDLLESIVEIGMQFQVGSKGDRLPAIFYNPTTDTFDELQGNGVALGVDESWKYDENEKTGLTEGQIIFIGSGPGRRKTLRNKCSGRIQSLKLFAKIQKPVQMKS